jgi:peptide/nickel transport system substrate-binding protein
MVIAALAVLAAGCTSSSAPSTNGAQAAEFTFALPSAPISLDIPKNFISTTMQVMALVTQKLELVSLAGQLSPGLATKVSQANPTTIVYTIRSGVKFSDGRPLTAADVAWSLQHVADAKAGAETAGTVSSFESATVTGPLQVTVKLKHPDPLARASLAVVCFVQEAKFAQEHAADLGAPGAVPVGTGPYKVSADTPQAITLTRNPYHWGSRPRVDKINFSFISSDTTAQLAMRSGALQGARVGNLKTVNQWRSIRGATPDPLSGMNTTFLSLDTNSPPLNDIHVRKAISYSLDRPGVMAAGYGTYAALLNGITSPALLADVAPSATAAQHFLDGLPQYTFSLAKARAEMAQSAYPHGFSLTVPYLANAPFSELTVLNLQQNMKALGVTIVPNPVSQSQWTVGIYAHKDLGMQTMQMFQPVPDPGSLLGLITGTANRRPQAFNVANWSTPAAEKAYAQLTTSLNKTMRWQATQTLVTAIAENVPYIPLFAPETVVVLGPGFTFGKPVTGFDISINGTWASALLPG